MGKRSLYNPYCWFALLLTIILLHSACKDEYSYEGNAPVDTTGTLPFDSIAQAQFNLLGSPDTCIAALVTGTYRSGDTLTDANTITLQVTVAVRGRYKITTDTLDGIYFSTASRFDRTGDQTLTLAGNGIPKGAGRFSFRVTAAGMHCTFYVPIEAAHTPAAYLLIADPSHRCVNQIIDGTYATSVPLTTSNQITLVVDVKTVGTFTIKTPEVNGMVFSYSGHFTNTGYQYVKLTGTGIPQQEGTYAFIPRILGAPLTTDTGCTFYVTVF